MYIGLFKLKFFFCNPQDHRETRETTEDGTGAQTTAEAPGVSQHNLTACS